MKTLGNILWFVFVGWWSCVLWVIAGILWCIIIIGIPFGKQCFKIAGLSLFPFGKDVSISFDKHPIANIIWILIFGWEMAIFYLISSVLLCITIIGIPFAKQSFKLAKLALIPFGAKYQ